MISNSSIGAVYGLNANFKNDTNTTNSTSSNVADLKGIMGPRVIPVTNHNNTIVMPQNYSVTYAERYRIDFTNWHFIQHGNGNTTCIVYIPNLKIMGHDSNFYNFHTVGCDRNFISTCDRVPEGLLTISHSAWYDLQFNSDITVMKAANAINEDSFFLFSFWVDNYGRY